jgi:replicative DNA helicase
MNTKKEKYKGAGSRERKPVDLGTMIYGKVPPQAKDLEEVVLGAMMLERDGFDRVSEILKAEHFYVEAHQRIFKAIGRLAARYAPIDIMMVAEELKKTDELEMVGGPYYVSRLTNAVVSSANIEPHSRIIYEKWLKREMINQAGIIINDAYEDSSDAFDVMDNFEQSIQAIGFNRGTQSVKGIDYHLTERMQRMAELKKRDTHLIGIPSGFDQLDRITHGWQKTDLIILAARPAVGKTAFALNLARNAAKTISPQKKKRKVLFFSLEMSAGQLVDRVISAESEVWLEKISTGKMEEHQMVQVFERGIQPLSQYGIFIDDTPALNVYEIRSKTRYAIRKFGEPGDEWMIIVDYLQLMSGVEERRVNNREQEISNISRNLKKMAKELELPIIALSQLSREVEKRKGEKKEPQLSDLRESGAIEQDADMVMFLYRPEYYDITTTEMGESNQGLTEVAIAKHRSGTLARGNEAIKLKALLHIQKFVPWEENMLSPQLSLGPGNWRPVETGDKDDLPFK